MQMKRHTSGVWLAMPRRLGWGAIAALATVPTTVLAAPLILEAKATLPIPDARFSSLQDVDIDGDSLIMTVRSVDSPNPFEIFVHDAAFLYRRNSSGGWAMQRKLFEEQWQAAEDNLATLTVAMENGLAAVNRQARLRVYQRSGADWAEVPAQDATTGENLEIDAGTILGSEDTCGWGAEAFRKDATGTFKPVNLYFGVFDYCDGERIAGEADISGTTVVVPQPDKADEPGFVPFTYVWEGLPPSPPATIPQFGTVSIEADWIGIGGTYQGETGTHFYRRQGLGNWLHNQAIVMPDGIMTARFPSNLQMEDGFVMQTRGGNIEVLRRDANNKYQYVAKLLGAGSANVSERTVVGVGEGGAKVFELPLSLVQPEFKQDDFQDLNAADWTPQAGSSFAVVASNGSYVYRQSSLAGNAVSIYGNTDWKNQSVQADIKPTAFAAGGSDRWFGLIARYTDANNYYYVTARRSNVIQIRKNVNGVFQSLASAALPASLNRTYNVRLEAIGTLLRLYVDNKLVLETRDSSHSHGQAGVMMYMTRADYDNVIVSTQQLLPLLADDFSVQYPTRWMEEGEGTWSIVDESRWAYEQSSLAGTARSISGIATRDQIVQATARPTAFASGGERWFGLVARYVDASNYYYVTLRNNNTVSLRKVVNGAITVLDNAGLTVSPGTTYGLRLEALGNSLRVYVNGRHVLEANDTTFAKGRYGFATYKTSAQFDDFLAAQP
jgi:hypothetical protein